MIHHQSDLCLRVGGYIDTLMDNAADHLMMRLTASLLVRSRCIAVKHPAAAVLVGIEFDALRVRELAAVICQKYREQLNEGIWAKLKCIVSRLYPKKCNENSLFISCGIPCYWKDADCSCYYYC